MKLLDIINIKKINILYKNQILEQEYSKLGENHYKLEDNYEYALYSSDEKTQTIKKIRRNK